MLSELNWQSLAERRRLYMQGS